MRGFLHTLKSAPALLSCAGVVIWHSINITWLTKRKNLTRAMVNQRLNKGAHQVLSIIKAKYHIEFVPDFKMDSKKPYIFMANHLSLFDLPLLYATISGTTRFLVKESLFRMPIFGEAIRQSEFFPIDIKNPDQMQALFDQIKEKLNHGLRIFIFPEGARSLTGELLPFKPGGFRLARETGANIIPIGIIGTDKALPAKTFRLNKDQILRVKVGNPIETKPYEKIEMQKSLMEKVEKEIRELCG